jgi:hypothetical protein
MSNNSNTIGGYQIPDVSNIDLSKLKPQTGPDFITAANKRGRDFGGQLVFRTGYSSLVPWSWIVSFDIVCVQLRCGMARRIYSGRHRRYQ